MARPSLKDYYTAERPRSKKDVSYQLIRFHIPKRVGKPKRRDIIEAVLAKSRADTLVEIMSSNVEFRGHPRL